jgi:hypothetical protein
MFGELKREEKGEAQSEKTRVKDEKKRSKEEEKLRKKERKQNPPADEEEQVRQLPTLSYQPSAISYQREYLFAES